MPVSTKKCMKIQSVSLDHFQSHTNTVFKLHSGVNAIVGSSDVGKTSILRALRWVFHNEPSGDTFRTHGAEDKPTRVIVTLRNGTEIERLKSKTRNEYILRQNGKEQVFKSFKSGVPEPILACCPLSDLNWQQQMDPAFALSSSPPELGRALNEVANLDEIDLSLNNINGKVRQAEQKKAQVEAVMKGLEGRLASLSLLPSIVTRMTSCEAMNKRVVSLLLKKEELRTMLRRYRELRQQLQNVSQWKSVAEKAGKAQALHDQIIKQEKDVVQLSRFVALFETQRQAHQKAQDLCSELKQKMPKVCPLCGAEEGKRG